MGKYHGNEHTRAENNNHSNQLNQTSYAYWSSRANRGSIYVDDDDEYYVLGNRTQLSDDEYFCDEDESNYEGESMFVELPAKSIVYYRNDAIKEIEYNTYFNLGKIITLSIKTVDDDIELVKRIPEAVIKTVKIEKNKYYELICEMYNIQYSYQVNNEFRIYIPIAEKVYVDRIKDAIIK